MLWAELNDAAAEHGLAVTGGAISTTGIGGYTLGGGLGWLMAKHGLAADNLLGVELVTADGEVLEVDADSHPDLFWALRGGGGNFGVATSFTYRLHPLQMVVGGLIAHPIDAAPELLRFYRDAVAELLRRPDRVRRRWCTRRTAPARSSRRWSSSTPATPDVAERELAPFKTWGSPLMVEVGPMPYPVMNTLLDAGYPAGSLNYWLSSFTRGLPGRADRHRRRAIRDRPVADDRDPVRALPRRRDPRRRDRHRRAAPRGGLEPADPRRSGSTPPTPRRTSPGRGTRSPRCSRTSATGRWLNYLGDDQADDAIRAAYGPNYDRLVEVKRRYDPDNVFHLNHNIVP